MFPSLWNIAHQLSLSPALMKRVAHGWWGRMFAVAPKSLGSLMGKTKAATIKGKKYLLLRSLNNHQPCSVHNRATWSWTRWPTVADSQIWLLPGMSRLLKFGATIFQNFSHYYISVHEGSNLVLSNYGTVSLTRQANLMPDALNMAQQV